MPSIFDVIRSFVVDNVNSIPANLLTAINPAATPSDDPAADATAAGVAILDAIAGGYTLQPFTSSNASWAVPPELANATEAYAIAVGGGGKGANGGTASSNSSGGVGGSSGGYSAERIDPSTLGATLNITIGAAASSAGVDGDTTSIVDGATTLVHSVVNQGSIATTQGYVPSNSLPGTGGQGGSMVSSTSTNGLDGESNAFATGGAGGALFYTVSGGVTASGGTGSAGDAGQTSDTPLSGGAGGGGGGGCRVGTSGNATGGTGGAGGFPGGGSGGGGSASQPAGTPTAGVGGTPGNGFAALLWK